MSRPRATHPILLLAACAAPLLMAGCNPDTRELLLDPRLPVAESYAGGAWTASPVLTCGRSTSALAAWSRDDVLIAGWAGLAVRVQGGVARNVDLPTTYNLLTVVAQPDGPAWAAANDGTIYRLDGEAWSVEHRSAVRLLALWSFPDGTLLGVGTGGYGLRRTVAGAWESFDTGAGVPLGGLWARDRDDCWAVGENGVVAHFDGAAWSVERPFAGSWSIGTVAGDVDGRVVVVKGDRVHLREAGVWRDLPELPPYATSARGATFLGGRLLAWNYDGWYGWDGAAWVEEGELSTSPSRHLVLGDDLLLADSKGALLRLAAGGMETLLPALGSICDFETSPEGAVILTTRGWLVRETAAGWRPDLRLIEDGWTNSGPGRHLLRRESGSLLALVTEELLGDSGEGWAPLPQARGLRFATTFPLADGGLLLWDGNGVWTLSDSRCALLCAAPEAWGDLVGVAGPTPAGAGYLFPDLLARYDRVTLLPVASNLSLSVSQVCHDPVEGLLLAGAAGLFAEEGAGTRDITPRCVGNDLPERAEILDFAVTPGGDWLAWTENGQLLRRRAGLWQSLEGLDARPLLGRGPAGIARSIRAVGPGEIWLATAAHLLRYRDSAP